MIRPEIQSLSFVLLGSFTPSIFQPAWFASQNLLGTQDSEAAKIEIIHPQVTVFRTDWLNLDVNEDRFLVSTINASAFEALRDLFLSTFRLLISTPIRALGMNRSFHYRVESDKALNDLGDLLAPKQHWNELLPGSGLRSLLMESPRADKPAGYIRVKVEPSVRVRPGVFLEVNNHFDYAAAKSNPSVTEAIQTVNDLWDDSMDRSEKIALGIAQLRSQ